MLLGELISREYGGSKYHEIGGTIIGARNECIQKLAFRKRMLEMACYKPKYIGYIGYRRLDFSMESGC